MADIVTDVNNCLTRLMQTTIKNAEFLEESLLNQTFCNFRNLLFNNESKQFTYHSNKEGNNEFESKNKLAIESTKTDNMRKENMSVERENIQYKMQNDLIEHQTQLPIKLELIVSDGSINSNLNNILRADEISFNDHEKKFQCDECNYSAPRKFTVKAHINSVHLKIKNHVCNKCNYAASQRMDLIRHVNSVHEHIKDYY